MKSITKYDFISCINSGDSLLVGEGNWPCPRIAA